MSEEAILSDVGATAFESAEPAIDAMPIAAADIDINPAEFGLLTPNTGGGEAAGIDLFLDVSLQLSVELGRARMSIGEVLGLRPSAVVELDKLAGEPADILVNGTCVARGEVVVVDEKFGVRVLEVVSKARRLLSVG